MKFLNLLIPLFLALPTTTTASTPFTSLLERKAHNAAKNGTKHTGNFVNRECAKMARLTHLTALVSNATKLSALEASGKLNATQISDLKAKAGNATAELQTLQSNATLVTTCAVVDAHEELKRECKAMTKLQKLVALGKNATAMKEVESKKGLNESQVARFQERVGNASVRLQDLMGNQTLVDGCAELKAAKSNSSSASSTSSSSVAQSTSNAAAGLHVGSGLSFGLTTFVVGFMMALL